MPREHASGHAESVAEDLEGAPGRACRSRYSAEIGADGVVGFARSLDSMLIRRPIAMQSARLDSDPPVPGVSMPRSIRPDSRVDLRTLPHGDPTKQTLWLHDADDAQSTGLLIERVLRPRPSPRRIAISGRVGTRLLEAVGGLAGLARASAVELASHPGVGQAGADRLVAAIELGRRAASRAPVAGLPFRSPDDVDRYLRPLVRDLEVERFHVFCLDARHRLKRCDVVSIGTLTASLVHPREVFRIAVRESAAAILLAHNHPSGDPTPSVEDAAVTQRLSNVGRLVGVPVLDHVIVAGGGFYSFREAGRGELEGAVVGGGRAAGSGC